LFSAIISEHFSKTRMIISAVAAKIWYLRNMRFLLGHPVNSRLTCDKSVLPKIRDYRSKIASSSFTGKGNTRHFSVLFIFFTPTCYNQYTEWQLEIQISICRNDIYRFTPVETDLLEISFWVFVGVLWENGMCTYMLMVTDMGIVWNPRQYGQCILCWQCMTLSQFDWLFCLCSQLERLQKKHHKLHTDTNSSCQPARLPATDRCEAVIRNSGAVPAVSVPVDNVNLKTVSSLVQCRAAVPSSSSLTCVSKTHISTAGQQHSHASVRQSCHTSFTAAQCSTLLQPSNGLVSASSSCTTTTQAAASVTVCSGQFVQLTIPTMMNLSGTNIHIRQFVPIPPRSLSSSGITQVCTSTAPQTTSPAGVSTSAPGVSSSRGATCSVVTHSTVHRTVASFQQFHRPLELSSLDSCHMVGSCVTSSASLSGHSTSRQVSSLSHDRIIPDIPASDPSCSSHQ